MARQRDFSLLSDPTDMPCRNSSPCIDSTSTLARQEQFSPTRRHPDTIYHTVIREVPDGLTNGGSLSSRTVLQRHHQTQIQRLRGTIITFPDIIPFLCLSAIFTLLLSLERHIMFLLENTPGLVENSLPTPPPSSSLVILCV